MNKLMKMRKDHGFAFLVLAAFAIVCFWRGAWGLLDEYLLPGNNDVSLWISLFAGLVIMFMLHYAGKKLK